MTVYAPLDPSSPFPGSPHFLVPSSEPTTHVQKAVKAILKARRIAIVCGAGISVKAGIPDFRSETGLFHTLKKDHASLSSGKDLFDASVFNSEATTSLFCQMIAQLSELSKSAQPTAFHHLLHSLDNRGRLLRVYTQNIDALESRSGLTFGIPELEVKRSKPRSKGKVDHPETDPPPPSSTPSIECLPSPPVETPRCIPLHGTLQNMHCQICLHSFSLENYLCELNAGTFPVCPECSRMEETRQAVGKRSRGVGKLRPSVVLYNEMHKDGEEVGEIVRRDLLGNSKGKGRAGADLLVVVGTSLRVPGTKRIVREFSKAIHARSSTSTSQGEAAASQSSGSGLATPTPSPRRSPTVEEDTPIKTIYINLDFPMPMREWEGVFDVWIHGDAQSFARLVRDEMEKEDQAKEAAMERKRRREEMKAEAANEEEQRQTQMKVSKVPAQASKKRKGVSETEIPPKKKRKVVVTAPPTPPISKGRSRSKKGNTRNSATKLTIRIPPRSVNKSREPLIRYPITPPPSQRHTQPGLITHKPSLSVVPMSQNSPLSSPPSPLPSSPLSSPPLSSPAKSQPHSTNVLPNMRTPVRDGAIDYFSQRYHEMEYVDIETLDAGPDDFVTPCTQSTSASRDRHRGLRPRRRALC